ncbi:MAG: hypothetical protein PHI90_10210 [Clostridia bacterium]|nr:hypothetical protein [Clostridia bacterium]MDD4049163.1 hypothetical protein [Clostridia bacterium]
MFKCLSSFYFNRALRLARKAQISGATQNIIKAVCYDNDNLEAWNLAGLCYYRLGKYKTAEYCWGQSVDKCREGNVAVSWLADLKNTMEETFPYFSKVITFYQDKKYGQAAGSLSKEICSRFDLSTDLLNYLGVLWMLDGKKNAAFNCWTTVLSIDQSNDHARLYLEGMKNSLSYKLYVWKERLFIWGKKLFKRNEKKEK